MPAQTTHMRFPTRERAYREAVRLGKKKAPNTSISVRKQVSMRGENRQRPWIVSVRQT